MRLYNLVTFVVSFTIIGVCSLEEIAKSSKARGIERNLTNLASGREHDKNKEDGSSLKESASSQSPSITSVHQVWTSTSSGRLDELSPEVIGKLRNGVPFLAAYALRPRLVGAITSHPSGAIEPLDSYIKQAPRESSLAQASDASERRVSLLPSLGDFSEFKVETSSTSKSEHHHKRRSSLKRKPREEEEAKNSQLRLRKRVLQTANRLLKRRRDEKTGIKKRGKVQKANLRRKLNEGNLLHHMSVIKHGRYIQANGEYSDTDGVKGGKTNNNKKPFYESGIADSSLDQPDDDKKTTTNGNDADGYINQVDEREKNVGDEDEAIENEDDELKPPPTAKRVGDNDVEEDGDTVTVMPKSDGVDDDPELPDYEEPVDRSGDADERGQRVDREKPGGIGSNNESSESDGSNQEDSGSALGGGLGATTGGGSATNGQPRRGVKNREDDVKNDSEADDEKPGVEFADTESNDEHGDLSPNLSSRPSRKNEQDNREENDFKSDRKESEGESFDDMRRKTTNFEGSRESKESSHSSTGKEDFAKDFNAKPDSSATRDEADLDYRDELDKVERERGKGAKAHEKKTSNCDDGSYDHHHHHHHHGHHDHHNSIKWLEDAIPGKAGFDYPIASRINSTSFNCREQKYPGYYADVESRCQVFHICQADGRQDSFLCPNGTIFSQKTTVCVWWNSFDCEVDFSSYSTSPLTNNYQHELSQHTQHLASLDAPKYYDLNALLYKSPITIDGKETLTELRPKDREDSESSIDSLIKAMRRRSNEDDMRRVSDDGSRIDAYDKSTDIMDVRNAHPKTKKLMDDIGLEDEASIQRKSTALSEDESTGLNEARSSRLRRLNSGPRRKRRASARQAPPKLKSRRVSRNSRRWKLRHGYKPKRRA